MYKKRKATRAECCSVPDLTEYCTKTELYNFMQ